MTSTDAPIRLLGISGSLRKGSHCTAVLRTLADRAGELATITLFPLNDVPLYDQDLDTATPPAAVAALKQAIAEADGLIVITPEYNYGISGVLKNALDWASRPAMKSPMVGKPALIASASMAFTGGARAQAQLRETLAATMARPIARPQVVVPAVHEKVKDGVLVDEAAITFALGAIGDLVQEVRMLRLARGA
ncbi:NAD(P)H-dependent oxidoreductase [Azospirillum sp. RWY-5-1]|uniref:NAD(P)H-dependent oxidoreductase n=1 Tax=Azospirillum oleiclasticum TaxID=2735135 RepID=A0ABX2T6B1_9PROT|nr:NAD(P)H-dependent oxidoreductase [Azospirillum oleiclasticum]NYZ11655.1 NAD(P)H-dependent oxidoreductase [Azospirillum oleiclasticum]NYZ18816.1 NAD(P)H-dependent oxidoreductase [Azospirillum oleiclasticum]